MSNAQKLTVILGGTWYQRYGAAPCPVCQPDRRKDQNALTLADGCDGRVLLDCKKSACTFFDIRAAAGFRRGDTRQELVLAEDLFRRLETARWNHETQSAPAPLVHWSRVLERLLKNVASEVLREVEAAELGDRDKPIVSKIQGGHASLGELVSVLLEFKKRLRGASNAAEITQRFEQTNFFLHVADNVQHREGLRLIGKLRNRAPHDASLDFTDVLLAKYTLFTTGLLKALIVSSS